jgi:uncharacterized phage protein (TIGR02220 family)
MDYISFIKSLQKKGKIYYEIWLSILFRLEEEETVSLNRKLDYLGLSKSQFYRIISYGIKLWGETITTEKIELKYGKLTLSKKNVSKKTIKDKKEKTIKKDGIEDKNEINMEDVYDSIISYLNQKASTSYKSTTNSYRVFINNKLKNGYKLEDFYKVIDNKTIDWIGTDFEKFLRPETLFGNKFDTYLNQNISKKTIQEIAYEQVSKATELGWNSGK